MKKSSIAFMLISVFISIHAQEPSGILKQVSDNIDSLKNVSYKFTTYGGERNDTVFNNYADKYEFFTKNKNDSVVRTKHYFFKENEPDKVYLIYDGVTIKRIKWDNKIIKVDSLNSPYYNQMPYYPVMSPLLIRINAVISYAINHPENSKIIYTNYNDSIKVKIDFPNNVIEFMNMLPWIVHCPQIKKKDEHSSYTIWINNDMLPYKFLREVHTERRLNFIKEFEIKNYDEIGVLPNIYIPDDFIYLNNKKQLAITDHPLESKLAPSFELSTPNNNNLYSLDNYKGKVTLLFFTGIGCGHCKEALPLLNKLGQEFKELDIIGIETFVEKPEFIKNYMAYHKIDFDYLVATDEIKKKYQVRGVPHFFILDSDHRVIKSIKGYRTDYTDDVITEEIRKLTE